MNYIPLSIRTSYSLLQSTIKVSDLKSQKQFESIGIIDEHNLFGAMDYNNALVQSGIKPITGCSLTLDKKYKIMLYCQNELGYKNLCKLISSSYKNDGTYVSWDDFETHSTNGLLAIVVPGITCESDPHVITSCADKMHKYFKDTWYVGIVSLASDEQNSCYMSAIHNTPIVAVPEVRCLSQNQNQAYQALSCIKDGKYFEETNENFALPTFEEISAEYGEWTTPIENTVLFAQKCSFILKKKKPELPIFDKNIVEKDYIREKAFAGLTAKLQLQNQGQTSKIEIPEEYKQRLEFELNVIDNMGFNGYFLIVADFINWSKENDVPVGPGRGSGAGSLVAYAIGITEIDPLPFGLVFERFLNPGRVSMPDFDVDFCPRGRNKVIKYISQKYGQENVSHIITFGSLQSKGVLRDVGRILQIPYFIVDKHSKAIPVIQGQNLSLEKYMENNDEIIKDIDNHPKVKQWFELSLQLEGLHRHASIHAAGIVIGKEPLQNLLPLYKENNMSITQFSLNYIEDAGLVKFDLLGLTALTIIKDTISMIVQKNSNFDLNTINLQDPKTLAIFKNGYTTGIFQFESRGMTDVVQKLDPKEFEDLIAVISLYRPGPMENIPLFISRKHGEESIHYMFPEMEKTLQNTYGILVYQEQVLEIARNLAGYSMQEADLLRRAIGKKKPEEMKKHKTEFTRRIVDKMQADESKAIELFEQIESFAKYAFVKAHATPYALIGYQMAYLKAHYTIEFMIASMIIEHHNLEKVSELIYESKDLGINFLIPNINLSDENFTIASKDTIRFGLINIKNVGTNCVKTIMQKRPFSSIKDFFSRVQISHKSIENLIKAGAFDTLEKDRSKVWHMKDMDHIKPTLFEETFEHDVWDEATFLQYEYDVLGLHISKHPLQDIHINKINIPGYGESMQWGSKYKQTGLMHTICKLEKIVKKKKPNGDNYLICFASDPYGTFKFIYSNSDNTLSDFINKMIHISGENTGRFFIIKSVKNLNDFISNIGKLHIKVKTKAEIMQLKSIIKDNIINNKENDDHDEYAFGQNRIHSTKIILYFQGENPIIVAKIQLTEDIMRNLQNFDYNTD